jgi:hypothetical protein
MNKDYSSIQKKYGDPFELLSRGKSEFEMVVFPLISIITGVVVGLTGKVRTGWTAVIALLPLQVFLLAAGSFAAGAFMRSLVYFLLVYFCASKANRLRTGSTSKAAPSPA